MKNKYKKITLLGLGLCVMGAGTVLGATAPTSDTM